MASGLLGPRKTIDETLAVLGQSRVAVATARDGLLPPGLATTHAEWGTPYRFTLGTVGFVPLLAAFVPLSEPAMLVSIGTLFAFLLVSARVLILRRADADRAVVPDAAGADRGAAVDRGLPLPDDRPRRATWIRFLVWMAIGLIVYCAYSRSRGDAARSAR